MRISLSILLLLLAGGVLGCQDATSPAPAPEPATLANTAQASSVPLRLWIVAPSLDTPLLLRQWQADSEQPLAPRAMTEEQLLAESRCNCDVLIYPARLIGELKQRGWLANLPAAVSAPKELEESEESTAAPPAAWQQQATYAGKALGVSLGCAVPTFVASAALGDALAADGTVAWDDVLRSLPTQESPSAVAELPDASIDRDALVDRFLAIVATVSRRDPAYGLLWDLQTLESRLGKAEFVRSAEILAALAAQPAGRAALLGDHSAAWKWAAEHGGPALAIAAPAQLDRDASAVQSGHILRLSDRSAGDADAPQSGGEPRSRLRRPVVSAWNTGGGKLASLSASCRQSSQAILLLRWLQDASTRATLSTLVAGVEAATPSGGVESLAWRARAVLSELSSAGALAAEPRLPAAAQYRAALADELLQIVDGRKQAAQALADADRRWREISTAHRLERLEYEKSLGLTL